MMTMRPEAEALLHWMNLFSSISKHLDKEKWMQTDSAWTNQGRQASDLEILAELVQDSRELSKDTPST